MLPLVAGPEEQRHHDREADRRGDAARSGGEPAGHHAEPALLGDGLLHAARKRVAKARERHGRARTAPFDDGFVDADGREQHARDDVARQDTGRRERRFVNEDLSHGAEDAAAEGDEVLVITIDQKLYGTYQGAHLAAADVGLQVHIVDSEAASQAEALLVREAVRLRDEEGLTAEEIAAVLEQFKKRVRIVAVVDSLKHLQKGGRLPAAVAIVGGALGIALGYAVSMAANKVLPMFMSDTAITVSPSFNSIVVAFGISVVNGEI